MFQIEAEKVLEKRVAEIHLKYAIINGEHYTNQKYKNYIQPDSKQLRSAKSVSNLVNLTKSI